MGNLTHTVSGDIASFRSAARVPIESLKCHFLPVQEGTGDPSPDNVRPITGWQGVELHQDSIYLPKEYQRVEYLESNTGKPYINTNILPTSNMRIYISGKTPPNVTSPGFIFGSRKDSGSSITSEMFWAITWNNWYCYGLGTGRNTKVESANINEYFTLDFNCNETHTVKFHSILSVNNSVCSLYSQPIYLFGINTGGNLDYQYVAGLVIKQFIVYEEYNTNIIIANFIPCYRKSDNKPGMYDTVSQTFFTNQGTGEFICGPDVGVTIPVTFPILGKNKFPNPTGEICDIDLIEGQTYTISATAQSVPSFRAYYDDDTDSGLIQLDQTISGTRYSRTFIPSKHVKRGYYYLDTYGVTECQIELGDTATEYWSYNSNNTVYSGYIDPINGVLVQNTIHRIIGSANYAITININNSGLGYIIYYLGQVFGDINVIDKSKIIKSNYFKQIEYTSPNNIAEPWVFIIAESRNYIVFFGDTTLTSQEAWNNFFTTSGTITLVASLNTPITYKCSKKNLNTYLDQNYIWSNTNDITEVSYAVHDSTMIRSTKKQIIGNEPHIETASGTIATFNTDTAAPLKECKIYFNPIQEGNGDPSPNNIRSISGWDNIIIEKLGKNIHPISEPSRATSSWAVGNFTYNNGVISFSNGTIGAGNFFTYKEDTTVTYSAYLNYVPINAKIGIRVYHCTQNGVTPIQLETTTTQIISTTFTCLANEKYWFLIVASNYENEAPNGIVTVSNRQIEINNTYTSYEPYNVISQSINFPSVLYGGYIDLINGQLVQTHKKYKLSDFTWTKSSRGKMFMADKSNIDLLKTTNLISDSYKSIGTILVVTSLSDLTIGNYSYFINNLAYGRPAIRDDRFSTAAAFVEGMKDAEIIAELVNPITYQLTPQQLKTLKGVNNIWSNANGPITVQYWTH